MKEEQAEELEQQALRHKFESFQIQHQKELTEMTTFICQRCGEDCINDPDKTCRLLLGLTWHIFTMYFNAMAVTN